MLKVLFATGVDPRYETRDGLGSSYAKLVRAAEDHQKQLISGVRFSPTIDRRFDCLLLVGAASGCQSHMEETLPKVGTRVNVARLYGNTEVGKASPPLVVSVSIDITDIILLSGERW